jgi:lysophospholipase L1-like esterase
MDAIERMVKGCRAAGAMPVVLSPFVYGSRYSTKKAIAYTSALRDCAEAQDMILVDCIGTLKSRPKFQILEHDGFHLSLLAHELVGQAIAQAIVADFRKRVVKRHSAAHLQSVQ